MAAKQLEDKVICNIVRAEIITDEETPQTYIFDTAEEATYAPDVSEGNEDIKRVKNRIVSVNKTEDIQYGSTLGLKDACFQPEMLALIDGVTVTKTAEKVTGYSAPPSGSPVSRKSFTLNLYTSEKGTDGEVTNYFKFSFPKCKGKPAKFTFKDGEYMTPEYTVVSRPAKGTSPYNLSILAELPAIV